MREILFRGMCNSRDFIQDDWNSPDNVRFNDWVYGSVIRNTDTSAIAVDGDVRHCVDVDPATIGQYTGLSDEKGNKIFEGDICTGYFNHKRIVGKIEYCGADATFYLVDKYYEFYGLLNAEIWLEVIGNIHDNPELLEGNDNAI